jgi:signal transduction histidine kinase/CheY-like chemotaxis protein
MGAPSIKLTSVSCVFESPVNALKQAILNMNFDQTVALARGVLPTMLTDQKAVMNHVMTPPGLFRNLLLPDILKLTVHREEAGEFEEDLTTFVTYPVFDTLEKDSRQVVGVLATNIFWQWMFSNLFLTEDVRGINCVIENSYGQQFSYRIDGSRATYLGKGDPRDEAYDDLQYDANVYETLERRASCRTRAYTAVPLHEAVGRYEIRIYPTADTEAVYTTNKPVYYVLLVLTIFALTSIIFVSFTCVVEKRQDIMRQSAVDAAEKTATVERQLNEFLSHEIRNPLSAAISACSFVSAAVNEPVTGDRYPDHVKEDVAIIDSSLHFVNDFLRSMLDIHRADVKQLKLALAPTDIVPDILEPVSTMLYRRNAKYEVIVEGPENLLVMTDCLRLKQVVLNLVRNASKFVERGFIWLRADIVDGCVRLYVEDTGPGIPPEKCQALSTKFQASLDSLGQGTGIGLSLSWNLMKAMNGDLWLDESYDSGVPGCPGARFVIQLNAEPLQLDSVVAHSGSLAVEGDVESMGSTEYPADYLAAESLGEELPRDLSVLFVDDDVVLRKLFVRAVCRAQPTWKVQEAASGEAAIRLCECEEFDLIFIDQYMSAANKQLLGTETTNALRNKGVKSRICGLSANNLKGSFLAAGADFFILKPMPCRKDELNRQLRLMWNAEGAV